jgi:hypothetical protein
MRQTDFLAETMNHLRSMLADFEAGRRITKLKIELAIGNLEDERPDLRAADANPGGGLG